jgi:hypothetical protein
MPILLHVKNTSVAIQHTPAPLIIVCLSLPAPLFIICQPSERVVAVIAVIADEPAPTLTICLLRENFSLDTI